MIIPGLEKNPMKIIITLRDYKIDIKLYNKVNQTMTMIIEYNKIVIETNKLILNTK